MQKYHKTLTLTRIITLSKKFFGQNHTLCKDLNPGSPDCSFSMYHIAPQQHSPAKNVKYIYVLNIYMLAV